MINIVIPMAGAGSRFIQTGYKKPKPFIDVKGKMMIERVLDNLKMHDAKYTLIAREEHVNSEKLSIRYLKSNYNCEILTVNKLTEGAACTILLACGIINNDFPLLLANSDQIVEMDINDYIKDSVKRGMDGSILTFPSDHIKWSYAKVDSEGYLVELREKEVISSHATVGLYYFQRGKDFVNSAVQMIANNDRVKNEFYTAPAYNYAVKAGLKIAIYEIKESQMHGLGTPEDLEIFLQYLMRKV